MKISRLEADHVREHFDSGVAALDDVLRRYARQNAKRGLSRTYVATRDGERAVLGYVTLRVGQVAVSDLPPGDRKGLPRYPVPMLHLARLAVDEKARGIGLGKRLLMHALRKALDAAEQIGVWGVEVVAKDEAARGFYAHYGFHALADDPLHLYISLKTVRKSLG